MRTKRLKIFLAAITIFVMTILCISGKGVVYASNSGSCGQNAAWTLDDSGKLTIGGSGSITENAFAGRTDIKQVIIGEQITSVGNGAFSGCTELWLAIVPTGVISIGTDAFKDTEVTIAGTEGSYASTYAAQNDIPFSVKMNFGDVFESDWFYESVSYVYYKGIMGKGSTTSFGVAEPFVRAQLPVVLYRFCESPDVEYMPLFPDASAEDWYAKELTWANQVGLVTGNFNGYFEPLRSISRQDFVQMLYRYVNYKGYDTSKRVQLDTYVDVSQVSDYAKEAMQWAVGTGILTGKEDGIKLAPLDGANKAEVATMIWRFAMEYEE